MIEISKESLVDRYPLLADEIDKVILWWRGGNNKFEIPNHDTRVDADTKWATHADVYDLLSYHKKSGVGISDDDMRLRNKQLFSMLRNEFGWKEIAEEFYPDPMNIF